MSRISYEPSGIIASGPYSSAIDAGEIVYLSGQTAMNSEGGQAMLGDIARQTEQCFANLEAILKAAELTLDHVVKVNVFLTDMKNFNAMNTEYQKHFTTPYPARTCVAVLALPLGAEVEIEMIARKKPR